MGDQPNGISLNVSSGVESRSPLNLCVFHLKYKYFVL